MHYLFIFQELFMFLFPQARTVVTPCLPASVPELQLSFRLCRTSHIIPVLASLHWLPIYFRIHFKKLLMTYKALHGQAPEYISELLTPGCPKRPLRSAVLGLLAVSESMLRSKGHQAFAVLAAHL